MRYFRLLVALLVGASLPIVASEPGTAAEPSGAGMEYAGDVEGISPDAIVVVDNRRRHLVAIVDNAAVTTPVNQSPSVRLTRFSGTDFEKDREKVVPGTHLARGTFGFVPRAHAFDEVRGRLYVVVFDTKSAADARLNPHLLEVDSASLEVLDRRPLSAFPPGTIIQGLSYYQATNAIYALGHVSPDLTNLAGTNGVLLTELDGTTLQPRWSTPYVVPGCQKPIGAKQQSAVARTPTLGKVFIGCGTGNFVVGAQPGSPLVAEIDVRDPAAITTRAFPLGGSYAGGETLADPANERFLMIAAGPQAPVQAAWVFDERHGVFVGVVNAGSRNIVALGLDPEGGWFYVGVNGDVLVGSQLGLKVPQALQFREKDVDSVQTGIVPIRYARKVLIPTATFSDRAYSRLKAFTVKRPDFRPPAPPDSDSGTEDVPESAATTADFSGDGQAFGVRAAQVGGVEAAATNVLLSPTNGTWWGNLQAGPAAQPLQDQDLVLNDGNRVLDFARVTKAHLSQVEASAKAVSADRDAATAQDYETLTKKAGTSSAWPYKAAQCSDFGGTTANEPGDGATTTCEQAAAKVDAGTTHSGAPLGPGASFGSVSSRVTLRRDKARGLVTTASATVDNLVLAPGVSIGRILSTSESAANGRKGKAGATYTRAFQQVTIGPFSCALDCNPRDVVDRMNAVPGLPVRAELPRFEATASPGGAEAVAIRDAWEHQQETVLNGKDDTALHVPALRLVHYNDNLSLSRTLYDFAGTAATSRYNITSIAGFQDDGNGGGAITDVFGTPSSGGGLSVAPVGAGSYDAPAFTGSTAPAVAERSPSGTAISGLGDLIRRLGRGLGVLFTGRPYTLLAVALWCLLLFPFFVSSRRHYLVALVKGAS